MIASLTMYLRPEVAAAHDRYWDLIHRNLDARGVNSPTDLLERSKQAESTDRFEIWNNPELVLSQTCGMPYRLWLHDKVSLIGTPDFALDECAPGYYRSALVVRSNDNRDSLNQFREAVFAYNAPDSQSGYAAPFWHVKQSGFWFNRKIQQGSHVAAARAVAQGLADIAAIDAVTWRVITRYEPCADQLRVFDWTQPTPGLPYIASKNADSAITFDAVSEAITSLSEDDQSALGLVSLVAIPKNAYLAVPNPDDSDG